MLTSTCNIFKQSFSFDFLPVNVCIPFAAFQYCTGKHLFVGKAILLFKNSEKYGLSKKTTSVRNSVRVASGLIFRLRLNWRPASLGPGEMGQLIVQVVL